MTAVFLCLFETSAYVIAEGKSGKDLSYFLFSGMFQETDMSMRGVGVSV